VFTCDLIKRSVGEKLDDERFPRQQVDIRDELWAVHEKLWSDYITQTYSGQDLFWSMKQKSFYLLINWIMCFYEEEKTHYKLR